VRDVIEAKGLFSSLNTDRGSHDWHTEAAGGRIDKVRITQGHRAHAIIMTDFALEAELQGGKRPEEAITTSARYASGRF
jgi:hypothetical protein